MNATLVPDIRDRIKEVLLSYGEKEIRASVTDISAKIKPMPTYSQAVQALYRMEGANEIELIREQDPTGKKRLVGVRLLKMEPAPKIAERVNDAVAKQKTASKVNKLQEAIPETFKYIQKKTGIEEAKKVLLEHHLSSDNIIFIDDPLGEEAMDLLKRLIDEYNINEELKLRNSALERENGILKAREKNASEGADKVPVPASSN